MTYEEIVSYVSKKATKLKAKGEAAVQVDITGEGEGAFYVAVKEGEMADKTMLTKYIVKNEAVKEGKIEVAPYEYFDHDAKVIADGNDFIAYLDGKADANVLEIQGDAEKAAIIKELVSKAPAKAAAKPAEKKAAPAKAAAKPAEKKAEPAKEAEKKAEPAKEAEKKAEPAKAAAKKPAAKKAATKKK